MMNKTGSLALVLCCALLAWSGARAGEGGGLTLIYSGNLDGELEPCGCSAAGDFGGIRRRATMVDRLLRTEPGLVLISTGGLLAGASPQDRIKGAYILKGMAALGYDAIGLQWRDLVFGPAFLLDASLPWVSSNWTGEGFARERRLVRQGRAVAFFSWLDPQASPAAAMMGVSGTAGADNAPLASAIRAAKADGALVILSVASDLERARRTLPLEGVDILLVGAAPDKYGEPRQEGRMLVLQPGSRGMALGRLDLELGTDGTIRRWRHSLIPLPQEVPAAPRLQAWYDAYNAEVKAEYERRAALRAARMAGETAYRGAQACKDCHGPQYAVWEHSDHAHAFASLERVGKSFDPECIVCHTVGFEKEGGFVDEFITPQLAGVQCESCHGASRRHVESGGKAPVAHAQWSAERMCGQCHRPKHSPEFRLDTYWRRIAH